MLLFHCNLEPIYDTFAKLLKNQRNFFLNLGFYNCSHASASGAAKLCGKTDSTPASNGFKTTVKVSKINKQLLKRLEETFKGKKEQMNFKGRRTNFRVLNNSIIRFMYYFRLATCVCVRVVSNLLTH